MSFMNVATANGQIKIINPSAPVSQGGWDL
jgi:hypothetical protein